MYKIAITGGIGSGKTEVTDYLASKGYIVIDTDKMSHEMTAAGGKAIPYIREFFGDEYIKSDGSLDREKMRNLVYNNPQKRRILEKGTTDVIIEDTEKMINECEARGEKAVFIAIPLLFEKGDPDDYDMVWSIVASRDVRLNRIKRRDGFDEQMIRKIYDLQVNDDVRYMKSTDIIENESDISELHRKVDLLLTKYKL